MIEIENVSPMVNEDIAELKSAILTRVQGSNDKKTMFFNKRLPSFIKKALREFDALSTIS